MAQRVQNQQQDGKRINAVRPPPAIDPERPALVQPWREFVSRGWITQVYLEFTPTGIVTKMTVADVVTKTGVLSDQPAGVAKQLIIDAGLWSPKGPQTSTKTGKSTEEARPKKSLVKKDFSDGPAKLKERATQVAKALGETTAKGRIGSLKLMIEGCDTFDKWWKLSDTRAKIAIFADAKHIKQLDKADAALFDKEIAHGPCPFRGSGVPTPSEEDAPAEEQEAQPSPKAKAGSPRK